MKIAIITIPLHTNYGGILQAYALQTTLKRFGHSVTLIEPYPNYLHHPLKMPLVYFKRCLCKYILREDVKILKSPQQRIREHTERFIKEHISIRFIKSNQWNEQLAQSYDAFIVGSDQVWRPKYYKPISRAYLDFTKRSNVLRIAYAASFGTKENEYTTEQVDTCRPLALQFNAISVREESGISLCQELFGITVHIMPDPTMLLTAKDYKKLLEGKCGSNQRGNLLIYILDESQSINNEIEVFAKNRHLTPFKVNSKVELSNVSIEEQIQPPVEEWLKGFYDAEFVITDSFHACIFSIIFHKPFICIGNAKRGTSRFISLLNAFNLQNRLTNSLDNYKDTEINWIEVDRILNKKRDEAITYINSTLNKHQKKRHS
ncbi:MAG: polysaccharide pyruvyl transferase family protein [Bacteroidaceae bacterium]|nr:polysaccharide pyruvyl transferase family protein [Bacteroidaceae bacterium]